MPPRAEFVLLSMGIAALLLVAVLSALGADRHVPGLRDLATAARFAPAAALAAGAAAWCVAGWHARRQAAGGRWTAGGMTLRTLLAAFLAFPLSLALWTLVAAGIDQAVAGRPASFGESLDWLPVVVFYGTLIALLFGAVPAFILEYFACRRFLRRRAALPTGHA